MSKIKILEGDCDPVPNPAFQFKFKTDSSQNHCFHAIERGENVLAVLPTGSGKTAMCKYSIAHVLKKQPEAIIVYCSPIKALSNAKFKEFSEDFPEYKVGILTGDNKLNPDGRIIIMTTEILRNILYKIKDDSKEKKIDDFVNVDKIYCVIFDEFHYLNDKNRGYIYEECLVLLDQKIQLILLSATIANPHRIATWLSEKRDKIMNLIVLTKRLIPLNHYIFYEKELHHIMDNGYVFNDQTFDLTEKLYIKTEKNKYKGASNVNLLVDLVKYLNQKKLLQALFFTLSRKKCEQYANAIGNTSFIDHKERHHVEFLFNKYLSKYKDDLEKTEEYNNIFKLVLNGVGYHHSGMANVIKEFVEILLVEGLIKVLFCTETFAMGINASIKTVVLLDLIKHTEDGKRYLNTSEYRQMSGRSGRRGLDPFGTVIILPLNDYPEKSKLKQMMTGTVSEISSHFDISYQFILKIVQSESSVEKFMASSLFNIDNNRNIVSIQQELDKSKALFDQLEVEVLKFDPKFKSNLDEVYKLENINKFNDTNMFIVANKQQEKRKAELKAMIKKEPDYEIKQQKYTSYLKHKDDIAYYMSELDFNTNYVSYMSNQMIQLLVDHNYITEYKDILKLKAEDVTIKGVLAANINETDPLILTEIIARKVLHDLTAQEIVAIVAIFITDNKPDEYLTEVKYDVYNIMLKLKDIRKIYDDFAATEYNYNLNSITNGIFSQEFYLDGANTNQINKNIDIAYRWAKGATLYEISSNCEFYAGNFIRNILKISNICQDIKSLCVIYNDLTILPELEKIDGLILRDIVGTNSLYLQ